MDPRSGLSDPRILCTAGLRAFQPATGVARMREVLPRICLCQCPLSRRLRAAGNATTVIVRKQRR